MENQVPPQQAPPTKPTQSQTQKPSFDFDPRTKTTVKWSAIWYAAGAAIESIFGFLSIYFTGGLAGEAIRAFGGFFNTFPIGLFIREIIVGAIIGAIAGFVISKFYHHFQQWNVKFLKGKLDTFFKLLFYPSLAGAILGFLLTSTAAFAIGFMPIVIIFVGIVLSSFIYAKMLSGKVGNQYPPPNQISPVSTTSPSGPSAEPVSPPPPTQPAQGQQPQHSQPQPPQQPPPQPPDQSPPPPQPPQNQ